MKLYLDLVTVKDHVYLDCVDFALMHKIGGGIVSLPGKTKLDKERRNLCLTEIVRISIFKKE